MCRNLAFKTKAMRPVQFDFPVISVGNLSMGGTGKTPHVEYIVRLLHSNELKPGVLSRGYRRKTKGFILADGTADHRTIGDEPFQYLSKFDFAEVAVDEDRVHGVISMLKERPHLNAIVLDDAYQHRALKPGLNILLTEYDRPYFKDFIIPAGRLREWRIGYKRADVIVVTKCPEGLSEADRNAFTARLRPEPHQRVFYSKIRYGTVRSLFGDESLDDLVDHDIALMTGIANPDPLVKHLKSCGNRVHQLRLPDHHDFTSKDLDRIENIYDHIPSDRKIILTTEKDAMRLRSKDDARLKNLRYFYIEIEVELLANNAQFDGQIIEYVRENQIDSQPFGGEDGE